MSLRRVIHVDCDCFFAAVEMRENPHWREVPLAVGGDPSGRGVIATCNYPARRFGVRSAMPSSQALRLCPSLILVPGRMALYRQASDQVMAILRRYARIFEQVSVDEAFLEPHPWLEAGALARQIRTDVVSETGLTVSVGVAPNRFLAKVASDWDKPDGLLVLEEQDIDGFMSDLPVRCIPGVGPKLQARLLEEGIASCGQLQQHSLAQLVHLYGRMGAALFERARGRDDRPLKAVRERKSVSVERTFRVDMQRTEDCLAQLPDLWEVWQRRLESSGWDARHLQPFVKVRFSDFSQTTVADVREQASYDGFARLIRQALGRSGQGVRLVGIGARCPDQNPAQGSLF
jgi:DNA polymerase IV